MTPKAKELLDKLVDDYTATLDETNPKKGKFDKSDGASYIYNLFNGGYIFSAKTYREIFNHILNS